MTLVVAPALTPDSYTQISQMTFEDKVVAPALTPDSYTRVVCRARIPRVVAPALTPDSYTAPDDLAAIIAVVAPALTPDSYTRPSRNPLQAWLEAGFLCRKAVLKQRNLGSIDFFFLKLRQPNQYLHAGELFFSHRQYTHRALCG